MTLQQLKYFHAACKCGSITQAAKQMYVSQPSVSSAIKELEKEFGVVLFVRQYHGFTLTKSGERLYELSGKLLSHAGTVSEIMKEIAVNKEPIRLGVPPMIGTFLFPKIYKPFRRSYPDTMLLTTESGMRTLLSELENNTLDVAILPSNDVAADSYYVQPLMKSETVYCVSEKHPLAGRTEISVQEIGLSPLIMFKHGFYQNELVEQLFARYNLKPNVIHYTNQFYTLHKFIADDIATGFMLRDGAFLAPGVCPISLDTPILVDISLVWKKDHFMNSESLQFVDFCRSWAKAQKPYSPR